jgi:glycosyltransferase involved in cell wall biosynthesis
VKVLIYTHLWVPSVGGVEFITKSLADGLSEWTKTHPTQIVDISLLTQTPAGNMDDSLHAYRVVREPRLREWIRQIRWADIVHLEGPSLLPLALAWLLRKPVVLRHHGYQSICPNGILILDPDRSLCPGHFMARRYNKCLSCNSVKLGIVRSFRNLLLTFPRRWFSSRAKANVGISPHIARRLELPRTEVIWNGVPVPAIPASKLVKMQLGQPLCFAYVGRLISEKGVQVLLRACRELADMGLDFRLKVVGEGPERGNLEALATDLSIRSRTEFVGSIPAPAIQKTLAGAVAVIMPSVCEDVAPLAAMEQMMEGRLVIASDIGGLGLIVNGAGMTFPAGDVSALASCMLQVLQDPSSAAKLGEKGQHRARETFTREQMVEKHVRLYRTLMPLTLSPTD